MTSVLTFVPQQWREEFPHILLHDCGSGLQQEIGEIFIQVVFTTQVSNSLIQDSPTQTDLVRLIRCLLYGKEENFNSFNITGLLTFCLQTEMSLT